jgi:hypothetical protein
MKFTAQILFDNGEQFDINLQAPGTESAMNKVNAVANRLERVGRQLKRWELQAGINAALPGFVRVRGIHVSGPVYLVIGNAHIMKEFR